MWRLRCRYDRLGVGNRYKDKGQRCQGYGPLVALCSHGVGFISSLPFLPHLHSVAHPGTYVFNASSCEDCPSGYYAPTAQVDTCLECGAGDHTKVASKAITCSSCDGGTYSEGLAVNCSVCVAGTASSSRASSCSDCDAGKRAGDGAASCESCAGGSYSATGSANCSACGGGTYSSAGASGCSACGEFT
jgi:hypothetical protein